jgi:hypothetical protein
MTSTIIVWMSSSAAYRAYRHTGARCIALFAPVATARAEQPRYIVVESVNLYGYHCWRVQHTTTSWRKREYHRLDLAETHAEIGNRCPADVSIEYTSYPSRSFMSGYYWQVTHSITGDPRSLKAHIDVKDNETASPALIERLVQSVTDYVSGSPARVAAQIASAAAVEAVRVERAARIAATRKRGIPAARRQAEYLRILDATEEEIESLTVDEASGEIDRRKRGGYASLAQVRSGGCVKCGRPATMWASLGKTCDEHYDDFSD